MVDKRDILVACASAAAALAAATLFKKFQQASAAKAAEEELSTTSSSHGGSVYETSKAVSEYLMFHYGKPEDILPYECGPHSALDFATRTAQLCIDWCKKLNVPLDAAFDVGCAVGRTSFDLTSAFERVVGLDFSHAFVDAANRLKANQAATYTCTEEGSLQSQRTVSLPSNARQDRASFVQGDACNLPTAQELGGKFSVIHGANLLCRLPDPRLFLNRLPSLLLPGGIVVFVSPYSWLPQYTPKQFWLGGKTESGCEQWSRDGLLGEMSSLGFDLVHEEEVPFLIREHRRKYQWGCSHATIWRLKQ